MDPPANNVDNQHREHAMCGWPVLPAPPLQLPVMGPPACEVDTEHHENKRIESQSTWRKFKHSHTLHNVS